MASAARPSDAGAIPKQRAVNSHGSRGQCQLGATKEDHTKREAVKPRQPPAQAGRRGAAFNTRMSPRLAIPRPLAAGPTKRRTGEHGFSSFLLQCQRLLATASCKGKFSMDALGILLLPLMAARLPLERHFLTLSSRTKTGARKEKACYPPTSDAVLLSFDKERNWARWKTVQIGVKAVGDSSRAQVENAGRGAANDFTQQRRVGGGGLVTTQLAPPPPATASSSHMAPLRAGVGQVGPTLVQASGPDSQSPSHLVRSFLTIRHSPYVYQTEEWNCKGGPLYQLLIGDVMINMNRIDQISFESGQFFLASRNDLCTGAKSGHAIHLWRYGAVQRKLYISQSILFLREQDYQEAFKQLQEH